MTSYTLHHGDCLDVLRTLPDASVDAVITDPPYGTTACKWDTVIPFAPMWEGIKRVLKPRGACVLFSSQPFTSALVMSNPKWFKYEWVWEKTIAGDFLNGNNKPLKAHENILCFSDGTVANKSPNLMRYYPQIDTNQPAWRRINGIEKNNAYRIDRRNKLTEGDIRGRDGRMPRSVIRFPNPNHQNTHPTQKPLTLLQYLVKTYTDAGDVVLDFTMGSGTTGHACVNLGRSFIGIEQDAGYFAIAEKRLADAAMQQRMALEDAPRTPCTSVLQ